MTRYNYRQSAFERLIGRRPTIAVHPGMRGPLIVIGAAMLLVVGFFAVEHQRVVALDRELAALQERIDAAQRADAHVDQLTRAVTQLRNRRAAILATRRDTLVITNIIAQLGNELPAETWLTNLQTSTSGQWSIAGRSTQVDQIGATLAAIGRLEPAGTAQLVSINATGKTGRLLDFLIDWQRPQ